ncbi:hypothetical protein [Roseibium marinum]|uniref:Uncharacterized protein n=1 Tax=Roseibium marinum TaxID=281252 RepID=A0A2S3UJ82_9HYPH|nr:hypothetical protein [Roseibium marinum]POF27772.1 hypothetical protein CLV41_12252 [Roseibium marinum]
MTNQITNPKTASQLSKTWVAVVGAVLGGFTLLFLMGLVLLSIAGHEVPCRSTNLVNIVLSFGAAMSVAFIGGNAAAKGHLPLPGLKNTPMIVSASGGIAVLVIMLILTSNLFPSETCDDELAFSCPPGQQEHRISKLRFGFCYPRAGWELDSGAIGVNAADIYVRQSSNKDVGVHFHISLIPAGWAGKPEAYTAEVAKTWRQLDDNLVLDRDFVGGRDAYRFSLNVKDREGRSRPTEVTHIYLDTERLLEIIMTWFDESEDKTLSEMQRIRSSLAFARI